MKENFITFDISTLSLAEISRCATGNQFDADDIKKGVLVTGTYGDGKFTAIGYLRGMRAYNGEVVYDIVNAVNGEFTQEVKNAMRVNASMMPIVAGRYPGSTPFIGRVCSCNGEKTGIASDDCIEYVDSGFVYHLVPFIKETN